MSTQDGCVDNKFQITTVPNTTSISFTFYAAGTYYVDCDLDNQNDTVQKISVSSPQMSEGRVVQCNYGTGGEYTIGFGGIAINYKKGALVENLDWHTAGSDNCVQWSVFRIGSEDDSWSSAAKVQSINGRIGMIFPTLAGKTQPTFLKTFSGTRNISSVPADLFKGVNGQPGVCMFARVFDASGITNIPIGLFSDIHGTSEGLFSTAFRSTKISTIDPGVFRTIQGPARSGMFDSAFAYLSNLEYLPEDLFGGLTKDPNISSVGLFRDVFRQNSSGGIRKLPNRMFGDYVGKPDEAAFKNMFANNGNLTGYIPYSFVENIDNTDYSSFGSTSPFDSIWYNTSLSKTCPENMYQYITGFEGDFGGKVVCAPCPDGGSAPAGSVGVESCTSATVVCNAGQYLLSDKTTCADCPAAYPNSERGTRTIDECYAVVTYLFNNGEENLSESFYYSENPNGYNASLPTPSWVEDVFDGWYKNGSFTGGVVTKQTLFTNGNQSLYAKWLTACPAGFYKDNGACSQCPNGYTSIGTEKSSNDCYKVLSYVDSMDGSSYDGYGPDACSVGEDFILPEAPTKKGFNFVGWTLVQ